MTLVHSIWSSTIDICSGWGRLGPFSVAWSGAKYGCGCILLQTSNVYILVLDCLLIICVDCLYLIVHLLDCTYFCNGWTVLSFLASFLLLRKDAHMLFLRSLSWRGFWAWWKPRFMSLGIDKLEIPTSRVLRGVVFLGLLDYYFLLLRVWGFGSS